MEDSGKETDVIENLGSVGTMSSSAAASPLASSQGGIVAARGTIDGVVVRLDGRINKDSLLIAVEEFLSTRESFLGGSEIILEWVGAKPEEALYQELTAMLLEKYKITVKSSKLREPPKTEDPTLFLKQKEIKESRAPEMLKKTKSLFDGMDIVNPGKAENNSGNHSLWDEPDARLIYSTLRSGQKVETDHSLIIFGDVNSGAEIVAGGDIIVLGTLRGVAHAGAYDETGGGRVIFALNLQPTQLRIGMVISRSAADTSQKSPEIAKVEDGMIVVEPYSVKNLGKKM